MHTGRALLRGWLNRSHLTQTDAARLLGISMGLLSQWLNGTRTPSLEKAFMLQRIAGIGAESWRPAQRVPTSTPDASPEGDTP